MGNRDCNRSCIGFIILGGVNLILGVAEIIISFMAYMLVAFVFIIMNINL